MSTKYWVLYGDWDVGEYSDDVWIKMANFEIHTLPDPPKTDKIDERTIRNVGFDTLEEAEKHATNVKSSDDREHLSALYKSYRLSMM